MAALPASRTPPLKESSRRGRRFAGDAHGAAHARAAQAAVAVGILREVLLVVVLGEVELGRGCELGRDGAVTIGGEGGGVGVARGEGRGALLVVVRVDRRSVLRAHVVA